MLAAFISSPSRLSPMGTGKGRRNASNSLTNSALVGSSILGGGCLFGLLHGRLFRFPWIVRFPGLLTMRYTDVRDMLYLSVNSLAE